MSDALDSISNRKESFLINIHFQENATWQGTITWIEQRKTHHFRSTLEMLRLMDSAVSNSGEDIDGWED